MAYLTINGQDISVVRASPVIDTEKVRERKERSIDGQLLASDGGSVSTWRVTTNKMNKAQWQALEGLLLDVPPFLTITGDMVTVSTQCYAEIGSISIYELGLLYQATIDLIKQQP